MTARISVELLEKLAADWRTRDGEVVTADTVYSWCASELEQLIGERCREEMLAAVPQTSEVKVSEPTEYDWTPCERCHEPSRPTLFIDTGFAGESEPLCAKCIAEERFQMEEKYFQEEG